jgi:hypothetical protein
MQLASLDPLLAHLAWLQAHDERLSREGFPEVRAACAERLPRVTAWNAAIARVQQGHPVDIALAVTLGGLAEHLGSEARAYEERAEREYAMDAPLSAGHSRAGAARFRAWHQEVIELIRLAGFRRPVTADAVRRGEVDASIVYHHSTYLAEVGMDPWLEVEDVVKDLRDGKVILVIDGRNQPVDAECILWAE